MRRAVVIALGLLAFASAGPAAASLLGRCPPRPPATTHRIIQPRWLSGAVVTEYYPIREAWFRGRLVHAPGLSGRHREDWLYGPHGVVMNGEGLGADGRFYHFAGPYDAPWVNRFGVVTLPCWNGTWTDGEPAWLSVAWWQRVRFARGRSRALPFWHTVAVDPAVIPLGSRVFIPAYCDTPAHGWFTALDTGGAIIAYHFDVYRPPPATLELRALRNQKVFVVPPGRTPRSHVGCR
jgi:3D (Asp-Asp-Asp) domain-containing protein